MNRSMIYPKLRQMLVAAAAIAALALTGCGDEDLCADVTCDFGTCEAATGQCANPDQCRVDTDCVPGYECGSDYACEAVDACTSDEECDAGICSEGACVNPSSCEEDGDCLARTFCGPDNTCEPDPCNDVTCQRGTCERGTDNCVSADTCTVATEIADCIAGEKCADGTCQDEEEFCEALDCERGECSFQEGACVNAPDCDGSDDNCTEGFFCNDQDQCQADLCAQNEVKCEQGGECVPTSGRCENASTCTEDSDCLADHICLDDACRLADVACGTADGDGGCPGNQECVVEDGDATCQEAATCETSVDCVDGRQCGGQTCLDELSCRADRFEPNDSSEQATSFIDATGDQTLAASLCIGDTDIYTFAADDLAGDLVRGTIAVEINVPARDRGLGQLELTLTDPQGNTRTASTGAMGAEGYARIDQDVQLATEGDYTVEVSSTDDMTEAGVNYSLSINRLPAETIDACDNALPMRVNQRLSGDTRNAQSTHLGSSCTSEFNESAEVVYALELDEPQEVTVSLNPQTAGANFSMSLRGECMQGSTESVCVNETGEDQVETLTALLGEGTHFVIVQAADGQPGGAFDLEVESTRTTCAPGDDYCSAADEAAVCSTDGGRFVSVSCEASCNPSTGKCQAPEGDECFDAPVIDADTTVEVDLLQVNDDYSLPEGSCVDDHAERTTGPDQTYRIDLPAQKAVRAEVQFDAEVEGSLYFVEDCLEASSSCLSGAANSDEDNASHETASYANTSDTDSKTVYLVMDTKEGQALSTANLDVSFHDISCEPGARQCDGSGNVEMCDDYGIGFEPHESCDDACADGSCLLGDTCADAITLADGDSSTKTYDNITSHITTGTGEVGQCEFTSTNHGDEPEYIYEIDLQANEVLTVTIDSTTSSTIAYIMDTCGDADSCLVNGGRYGTSGNHELSYVADQDGPVYLAMSRNLGTSSSYGFTIDIDISPLDCVPDTDQPRCKDSSTLEYCVEPGVWQDYSCTGGCANDECGSPTGEQCLDAIPMADGDTDEQTYDGGNNIDPEASGQFGTCTFTSTLDTEGHDRVYSVDLQAGDLLTATYGDGVNTSNGASTSTIMYIMEDCGDPDSCVSNVPDSGDEGQLQYLADQDETVYVVMDRIYSSDLTSYSYLLDIDISQPDCDPDTHTPICDGNGDVELCEGLGTLTTYDCQDGGCTDGMCDGGTADYCYDAANITAAASQSGGTSITHDWSNFTDQMNADETCGLQDWEIDGTDAYYAIDLEPGDILYASLYGNSSDDPALVVTDDCHNPENSCLASDEDSDTAEILMRSDTTQTVYLIADTDESSVSDDEFTLDVEITSAECDPATHTPTCNADDEVEYCVGLGELETYACSGTCSNGMCDDRNAQSCFDADNITLSAKGGGTLIPIEWIDYSYDNQAAACGISDSEMAGSDAYFELDLEAGDVLFASLDQANTSDDPALILTDRCYEPDGACVAAEEDSSLAEITYVAEQDETLYLIADSDADDRTGVMGLNVEIAPNECTTGVDAPRCADVVALEYCNELGLWEEFDCDGGCSSGVCGDPSAQICADAVALGDGDYGENVFDGVNFIDPVETGETGSCNFGTFDGTQGPESIYAVDLAAGETMTASYGDDSISSGGTPSSAIMYLMTDCYDTNSCVETTGEGSTGSLTYTASQAETVYVVMDRDSSYFSDYYGARVDITITAP